MVRSFFVAPFRTVSLRGPVLYPYNEGASPSCDGWTGGRVDGWDGWDGHQKCLLFFFILRYIKHYTHIYLYTKEKLSGQISCGFIFWSSWRVAPTIFKITLLGRHFSKMSLKVDFLEKSKRISI